MENLVSLTFVKSLHIQRYFQSILVKLNWKGNLIKTSEELSRTDKLIGCIITFLTNQIISPYSFLKFKDRRQTASRLRPIGQVLCRYWIHQRMLPTASSPIHERIRLNQFQCSAINFLHLRLSWHVTSIFASVPKTNVVPVGLNWYYPQLPPQAADHEFFCHMLHPCCKITFQMSLLIYLNSEFNSYENLLCHQIVKLMRSSLTTG